MNGKKKEEKEKEKKAPARVLSPDQKKAANENPGEGMAKSMTYIMPLMTLWLTFTFPAALGLYWTVSNVLGLVQNIVLNKYYNKKLTTEIMLKDEEKQRKILTLYILKTFYQTTYPEADFYAEFYSRLGKAKEMFGF